MSRDSSVSTKTKLRAEKPGNRRSNPAEGEIFLYFTSSELALAPTSPLSNAPEILSQKVKQRRREAPAST
jgi:hypothetical protein